MSEGCRITDGSEQHQVGMVLANQCFRAPPTAGGALMRERATDGTTWFHCTLHLLSSSSLQMSFRCNSPVAVEHPGACETQGGVEQAEPGVGASWRTTHKQPQEHHGM